MTILYDPAAPIWAVMFSWKGTILPLVVWKPTFWLLITFEIGLLTYDADIYAQCEANGIRHGGPDEGCRLMSLDWDAVQLPASLLVFFLVFYGSNCYARFYELWGLCIDLTSMVLEFSARVNIVFPGSDKIAVKWRASRLMLAGMGILFTMLGGDLASEDPFEGAGVDEHEYDAFRQLRLLSQKEVGALKRYRGVKCVVPTKWALIALKNSMNFKSRDDLLSKYNDTFEDLACSFQNRCYEVILLLQQPVPFAYFHVLKMQMLIVLLLIGYSLVNVFEGQWYFSLISFTVIVGTMLGLQEIAVAMSDPFGDDDSDFDTTRLIEHAYNNIVQYTNEDNNMDDGSDADLVFDPSKRFQDFHVNIHGDEDTD